MLFALDNLLVEKNLCVKSCRVTFHNDGNGRCVACEGGVCDKGTYNYFRLAFIEDKLMQVL